VQAPPMVQDFVQKVARRAHEEQLKRLTEVLAGN